MPTFIFDQFGKVAQTIVDKVVDVGISAGMLREAPEAVIQERLAICAACSEYTGERCKQCGCFMLPKSRLAGAQCPIQKWAALPLDDVAPPTTAIDPKAEA